MILLFLGLRGAMRTGVMQTHTQGGADLPDLVSTPARGLYRKCLIGHLRYPLRRAACWNA